MGKYKNTIEPFAVGYIEADREYAGYKIACGMREMARHKKIEIDPGRYFVGHFDLVQKIGVRYSFGRGIEVEGEIFDEEIKQYPEYAEELKEIKNIMLPVRTKTVIQNRKTDYEKKSDLL